MITPEMTELIRQQRLNYLIEGSKFPKYTTRGRMKGNYSNWFFYQIIHGYFILRDVFYWLNWVFSFSNIQQYMYIKKHWQ